MRTLKWRFFTPDAELRRAGAGAGMLAYEGADRRLMLLDITADASRPEYVIKSAIHEWILKLNLNPKGANPYGELLSFGTCIGKLEIQMVEQAIDWSRGCIELDGQCYPWRPAGGGIGLFQNSEMFVRIFEAWRDADLKQKIQFITELPPAAEQVEDALHLSGVLALVHLNFMKPGQSSSPVFLVLP
jgi:hypothetical protein